MRIVVDVETATVTVDEDTSDGVRPRVVVRRWSTDTGVDVEAWDVYRVSRERLARRSVAEQLAGLRGLRRAMRRESPEHWSMLLIDHLVRASYLVRLELRAADLLWRLDPTARREGAAIVAALTNARRALGLGDRGRGRPRKN